MFMMIKNTVNMAVMHRFLIFCNLNPGKMNNNNIKILLKAVDCGSLNKAAEITGYTPSGLSHIIHTIEEEAGVPLITRTHKGISLSEEGQRLLPFLKAMTDAEDALFQQAERIREEHGKHLRIGAPASIASSWIPDLILYYQTFDPEMTLHLTILHMDTIASKLASHDLDIGFLERRYARDNLTFYPIAKDPLYAVVPAAGYDGSDAPIPLNDLTRFQILIPSIASDHNQALQHLIRIGANTMEIPMSNARMVMNLVKNGVGATVLSKMSGENRPAGVKLLPTIPQYYRDLGIMINAPENRSVKEFFSCLKEMAWYEGATQ